MSDMLLWTYLALLLLAIWGTVAAVRLRRSWLAWALGATLFAALSWLALGTGFSIRIPQWHERMVVIVWTMHENRIHALARPLRNPHAMPVHIVFSVNPRTKSGARMRRQFFAAVRRREGRRQKEPIVINVFNHSVEAGTYKYRPFPALPPKRRR